MLFAKNKPKMKKALLIVFLLVTSLGFTSLQAQDIHFSLFNYSPMTLNPALTGGYEGSFRVGGIYRDQYRKALGSGAFTTPMFYADAPVLLIGKKQRDWIGFGIMAYQDKAGIVGLQTGSFLLSVGLHHVMDKAGKTVLSFGLQGGAVQRKVDLSSAGINFGDEYNSLNGEFDISGAEGGPGMDGNAFDLNAGLGLKSKVSEVLSYNLGVSLGHILKPNLSVLGANDANLDMRLQGHAQLEYDIKPRFRFSPTLYYTNLNKANQVQLQAWGGYKLKADQDIRLNFGLGYRFKDAGELLLGIDVKGLKVALSYDMTFSDLRNVRTGGAFEIGASYIARNYKQPVVKTVILCPNL